MPSTCSPELLAHFQQEVTTIAICYRIELKSGIVQGFTSWSESFNFEGVTYKGNTVSGPTAIKNTIGTGVDNCELSGRISSESISAISLENGDYDDAELLIFYVNPNDLSMGKKVQYAGFVGEVAWNEVAFSNEARSLMQRSRQEVGSICMPTCRAELGDAKCGVNLAGNTLSGHAIQATATVTSLPTKRTFRASGLGSFPTSHFSMGVLLWLSGSNAGRMMEVKGSTTSTGAIELQLPMPEDVEVGDTFKITAGCDGVIDTCRDVFGNSARFQGEPHTPGADATLKVVT